MKNKLFVSVLMLSLLTACGPNFKNIGKESDPTRFFTLSPTANKLPEGQAALPHLMVGVGPVSVADYLDRSHIVLRKSGNQLELADFDRWAAAPEKEIQRVMAANLAAQLGTEKVAGHPWRSELQPDVSVEVAVEQFEHGNDGKVHLTASWQLYNADSELLTFHRAELSADAGENYEAISDGLSNLTGQLSQEIAAAIRRHAAAPAPAISR